MTRKWLAAHLYYAEPWESFLVKVLKPFIESVLYEGVAEEFFFIRYYEKGPHIRLRLRGTEDHLASIMKIRLESYFQKYFLENPSSRTFHRSDYYPNNSIQFILYDPEVERYGGLTGIRIAEQQFQASSQATLAVIEETLETWNYARAMGAAIQLHLSFSYAHNMSLEEVKYFYEYVSKSMLNISCGILGKPLSNDELESKQRLTISEFERRFKEQRKTLVPYCRTLWEAFSKDVCFEQAWLNEWLQNMVCISKSLNEAYHCDQLDFPPLREVQLGDLIKTPRSKQHFWSIFNSYIHMTNNRLGISNHDESYISFLIKRCIDQF